MTRRDNDARRDAEQPWRRWYKTARWQRLRKLQLQREPLCRICLAETRVTAATVADHVEPHHGDSALFWSADNLQSLCAPHHNADKAIIESRGHSLDVGPDGLPTDPLHPWNREPSNPIGGQKLENFRGLDRRGNRERN